MCTARKRTRRQHQWTKLLDLIAPEPHRHRVYGPPRLNKLVRRRAHRVSRLDRTDLAVPAGELPFHAWTYEGGIYAQAVGDRGASDHDRIVVHRAPNQACDQGYGIYCDHSDLCVLCDGVLKVSSCGMSY